MQTLLQPSRFTVFIAARGSLAYAAHNAAPMTFPKQDLTKPLGAKAFGK